jgi:hypothetical protein
MSQEIVNYDEAWAKQAQAAAEQVPPSTGTFISTRSGILSFGDEVLPGNQACVIILDMVREHTYYAEKFSEDNPQAPVCYAFGRAGEEMAPHHSMQADVAYFQPQSDTCQGCKHNEWGSANTGRGKACQNRERLALIPAGYYMPKKGSRDFDLELFTDPKHFQTADTAFIKLPVTSVAGWWKYVSQLASQTHRPPHGVVTRMFLEQHPKWQYQVHFEQIEEVPNELASIVMARHEEALKTPIAGYSPPKEQEPTQSGLRGLRRGR